jgi:hypothetical protein
MYVLASLSRIRLPAWAYFWIFCSIPLVHVSVCVPIPCWFCYYVIGNLSRDMADSCLKAELPKQRGLTLYALVSRLQRQKARSNLYVVTCNSTGYFTSSAMGPSSCFRFLSFISLLCHPPSPPTPATLSEHSLSVSLLAFLPATMIAL